VQTLFILKSKVKVMEISRETSAAVKPACWGAVGGAMALAIIGFTWGGWVTGGTAKNMASAAATNGQQSVLVPLCVAQFMTTDGAVSKIKETPTYNHDDIVREFVKKVVDTPMDYSLARACAAAVDEVLSKSAAKS
jgi:Flp pilus assembly protein protease CpaA